MSKQIYYFGCIRSVGHYLWTSEQNQTYSHTVKIPGISSNLFGCLDGIFAPPTNIAEGVYKVSSVPPLIIIGWNDRSVDARPASNSTFVFYGYDLGAFAPEQLLEDAAKKFPGVFSRQRNPLVQESTHTL